MALSEHKQKKVRYKEERNIEWYAMATKKILFVEDSQDNALLITEELELENPEEEVILMKDGQEAMDYLNETDEDNCNMIRSQIGLVLLDLNLPKVGGMSILKFLKKSSKYRSIPVIILTTSPDQKTIDEAYRNGADVFITKSLFFQERFAGELTFLREFIKSILMGGFIVKRNNETNYTDKYKEMLVDIIKRSRKITELTCEIPNESLKQSGEDNEAIYTFQTYRTDRDGQKKK